MTPGPVPRTQGPVIVSLTEFTAHRLRDLAPIVRDGLALRRGWWAMPGAIGVALYVDAPRRRGGSLSVWASAEDLRRFVALPRHQEIMRRYGRRVSVRAASWTTEDFRAADIFARREELLEVAGT
jgi:heme-degrading monooxygenase HmoA